MTYVRISSREDLESLRTSSVDSPEWWIAEYRLKGSEGLGQPVLEIAVSSDGERSVAFGDGPGVDMDASFLAELINSTVDELETWRGQAQRTA